jgi:hypothetical protein
MINRTTQLLITAKAGHKEYKKIALRKRKNGCDL